MQSLLVFAYVTLGIGTFIRYGMYDPAALVFVLASFGCLMAAGFLAVQNKHLRLDDHHEHMLTIGLIIFLIMGLFTYPGMYFHSWTYVYVYRGALSVAIPILLICYPLKRWQRYRTAGFITLTSLAVILRLLMPLASPAPLIDVHVFEQTAAANILAGKNPYTHFPPDVYKDFKEPAAFTYIYPPANLYFQTPSFALFGDVRFAHILAEAAALSVLWLLARRRGISGASIQLPLLLFLFTPRGLFALEQSWTEPLLLMMLTLALWLYEAKCWQWAAICFGIFVSLKQYLVFFLCHWLLLDRNPKRIGLGLGSAAALAIPFAIADLSALWHYGVMYAAQLDMRADGLTTTAWLFRRFGFTPGNWLPLAVGAIFTAGTWYWFRNLDRLPRFLFSATITTFAIFLFGKYAFYNYYYFVGGLMMMTMIITAHSPADQNLDHSQ